MIKYRVDHEGEYEAYLEQLAAEPKMYWGPGDPLPPWQARNERERYAMSDWVNHELNSLPDLDLNQPIPPDIYRQQVEWLDNLGPEIEDAEHGDIEPLRRKLPHLAKFLHLPKMERGRRFRKHPGIFDKEKAAARTAREIITLWKKHYGKKNRRADDGPSAAEIAAERWDVDVEAVLKWLKKIPTK